MIPRYTRPEMAAIWEPLTRFKIWFEIEAHAADAQAAIGVIPKEAAEAMVPAPETIYPAEDADYQAAFERWMATVAEAERTNS